MSIKKYKPEQIVTVLRQIEVQMANGKTAPQACKEAGIHTQTYYRWRKEYGGLKVEQAKRLKELEKENARLKRLVAELSLEKAGAAGCGAGKLLSPERRRCAVEHAREQHGLSERYACRLLGQWRGTQRYEPNPRLEEEELTRAVIALATRYGRYGYRRITALLRGVGWEVGKDRVQQIWRREGLKVPQKQKPRGRLWLNDGSCVRLRPERPNHVWSYDFMSARTHEGRTLRLLTLLDEYTRECLAIRVERRMGSPTNHRGVVGRDVVAKDTGNTFDPTMVPSSSPKNCASGWASWRPGRCTSNRAVPGRTGTAFGKLRDECLNGEIFYSLKEAQVVIEQWRVQYNTVRPHSALGPRRRGPIALPCH